MTKKINLFKTLKTIKNEHFSLNNPQLQELISKLEQEAKCGNSESKINTCEFKKVCEIYKRYEKMEEFYIAEKYLETWVLEANNWIDTTIKFSQIEWDFAQLESNSNVLFIWSWPFPETAIHLHKTYWCNIECVDICKISIDISRQVIKKMWFGECIKITRGRWEDMNYSKYTHIFLAAHVENKENIVKNIDSWKIILARFGELHRSFIYSPFEYFKYFWTQIQILWELRNNTELIHSTVVFKIN